MQNGNNWIKATDPIKNCPAAPLQPGAKTDDFSKPLTKKQLTK